jgi:ABC-type branched-subunit amino acid transport system substrate-binding protein
MVTDLTGPVKAQCAVEGWAAEDYFIWLSQRGGIDGHPTEVEVIDTKYDLSLIRSAYARIKTVKQATVSFDALSGGIEAHRQQFVEDKIPVLMCTGHGPALYPPGWVFSVCPSYDDVLCAYADYIAKNWKEKRSPRLALLLGDYASGRAPGMAQWYCKKKGIDVVAVEYVSLQPTDTSDILIRIRDAKPDFIFDTLVPDQSKVVLQDRVKLGIKIPETTFYLNSDLIMKTTPLNAYAGLMGFEAFSCWWEKDIPGVKLAYELFKKRGDVPPVSYMHTLGGCMVWTEAVKNALKKVGYEALDGPAIFDGYLGIKNFTAQGIFKNVSYIKDDLRGNKWLKLTKFNEDGSLSRVTDYMEAPWHLKLKAEMEKTK